jgi:A/G-specific adenine glycosylase
VPVPLADLLVPWFDAHARDLPWRRPTTTPWGILVSEFMLQQTPVNRVAPLWVDWMERWPTPSALAAATQADVLRAWGKLGYPRRALRLHAAATAIATEHADEVPDDLDELLALPGVGAYTARAVLAFGYRRRTPVVDTNVRRVIARAVHGEGDAGPARTTADLADAEALLPAEVVLAPGKTDGGAHAARFSAALMELGATICTARQPRCEPCPVHADCAWLAAGRPAYAGRARPVQRFAGTDRQVRGRLLDVLRGASGPVARAALDATWDDAAQRDRCLFSLLEDGLVELLTGDTDGTGERFALPGEG